MRLLDAFIDEVDNWNRLINEVGGIDSGAFSITHVHL